MWHYIVMALGWIIKTIYDFVQNYGVAIILFTVVMKLLLLPLNIKSQKAMKKQQKIQPLLAELQKKYANDQQKLQQETMKLYKENNVSMAGGCLPMLIQMPILVALYQAIQRPLTYMFNVPYKNVPDDILQKVTALKEAVIESGRNIGNLANLDAGQLLQSSQISISSWAGEVGEKVHEWYINFNFLGLDLSRAPQDALSHLGDIAGNLSVVLLLIIPVVAVISSVAQSKISMKLSGQDKKSGNDQAQAMNGMMTWMMPIMTGFFTFTLPAGIGLYWIVSGFLQVLQQLALNYYFEKKGEDFVVKVPEKKYQHGKNGKKH
ncbi:MAG: YidC/Oxa1 family membrane protein insertase [Clostridia bacterium]|nr:YidC/Oxa1 family membrane protein insertase [Clostridia bacterium]